MAPRQRSIAALKPARRGSFHPEAIANAEAEEEEEYGSEDGLDGGKHYEPSERSINCQTEIPAEAETFSVFAALRPRASP